MAISFDHTVQVPATPERVFLALSSSDENARWMSGFVRRERLTDSEFGVGTQFRETRKMFGRDSTEHFEVIACDSPTRLDLRVDGSKGASGKGECLFSYRLEPVDGGTRLTMTGEVCGVKGVMAFLAKFMVKSFEKGCSKELEALKDYLAGESQS
ncbi:Polyketide cyclase / dehydrase and lipid transport [compost metagenome]